MRGWSHLFLMVLLVLVGVTGWGDSARAHEFRPATLTLRVHADGDVSVRFVPPPVTARGPTSAALRPLPPASCEVQDPERWSCGAQGLRGTLSVAGLELDPVDVMVHVRWPDGGELRARLDARNPSVPLRRGAEVSGRGDTVSTYFTLGGEHILGGIDHLLFVLALLLLGGRARDHLRTITAFTVGHSLTLVVSTFAPVDVPGPWVEACIAASIAFAAAEALSAQTRRATAWVWALVFGLLHGLGFYGALAQLGLPPADRGFALLSFNLGVEAGQLAVVLVLLVLAALGPRSPSVRERVRRALAFAVGCVAVAWTLERVCSFWSGVS